MAGGHAVSERPGVKRRRLRWLAAATLTVMLGMGATFVARGKRDRIAPLSPARTEPLVGPAEASQPEQHGLPFLVRRYSEAEGPCDLAPPGHLADWHGRRFLFGEEHDLTSAAVDPVREALAATGTAVAYSRGGGRGRPWVALLPEYHGRQETDELVLHVATALATALGQSRVRVFVEALDQAVTLPAGPGQSHVRAGIEDGSVYPVSRAAWGILDLMGEGPDADLREVEPYVRRRLFGDTGEGRLLVGEHASSDLAEQAITRYEAAWNAMASAVAGLSLVHLHLPAGADYLREGQWARVSRMVELAVPADVSGYLTEGQLYFVAMNMAAVTSRIRTTSYSISVLETLSLERERVGLVQIGATHVQPLVSMLERAGATVLVLMSPKSTDWESAAEPWRCPVAFVAEPRASALGYFRLPGTKAERYRLELWNHLPESS